MDIPNHYLFIATLKDGTQIKQNAEDAGSVEGKNCFYDVLQKMDEITSFVLLGEHTYGVDLTDGHFEIDGTPMFIHNHDKVYHNFRVIYFRKPQVHANFLQDGQIGEGYSLTYLLGWQANDKDGKNHERIMEVIV